MFASRVPSASTPWKGDDVTKINETLAPHLGSVEAGGWEVGPTELGYPQFYLLGPPPDEECILCISRLGRVYVLEDGAGQVLFEHNSLVVLAEQAKAMLHNKRSQIVARIGALWFALRELFEEKLEPLIGDGAELLTHVVPQLAVLA